MFGPMSLRAAPTSLKLRRTAAKGEQVMRTKLLVLLAMVFTLAFVGTALGQDNPTEDAYGGVLGEEVSNQDDSGSPAAAEESDNAAAPVAAQQDSTDSLPFTGLELGLVALAGFGLVALGVAMRRGTRRAPGSTA
jgi:hypothetical protein